MSGRDNQVIPTKVSVNITCFNLGRYLGEAISSVQAQSLAQFEIVVVDDGSTEAATKKILDGLASPKTRLLRTANRGLAGARNAGIEAAGGNFILPLDADHKIAPSYLEKAAHLLETDPELGIVYCRASFFGAKRGRWRLPEYNFPEILLHNMIFCSAMFRKTDWEQTAGYKTNMAKGWEDYDFWLSLIELGRQVHCIPETLFFYRQRADSMAHAMTQEDIAEGYAMLFHNHSRLYEKNMGALLRDSSAKVRQLYRLNNLLAATGLPAVGRTWSRLKGVPNLRRERPQGR